MNVRRKNALAVALGLLIAAANAPLPVAGQAGPAGQAGGSPHAISLYNLGLTAYKQGSPESAIIFFKRACDIDPNLADAQYNLGVLYQSQKRLKEAVPRFQEVLRVKPSDPDAHYQVALCLVDLGQGQDARAHLAAIPPSNPHFADSQRRIQLIDAQAGAPASPQQNPQATAIAPTYPPSYPSTNYPTTAYPPAQTTVLPAAPNESSNPQSQPYAQVPQSQPSYGQPLQAPPTVSEVPFNPIQQVPPVVPTQPKSFQQPPSNTPVPLLGGASVRVIATGFSAPSGLGFDRSGNLYVANFTNNTIDRITADGSRAQFSSGSNLRGPIGLVVDGSGNVYVANYTGGTVARISPAGISTIIAKDFHKPYYLTLDKDANLFVSQQEDNSIVRISLPRAVGLRPQ